MPSPAIYINNGASQLAANIGPSDTALLVTAGQGVRFPSPAGGRYFALTLVHFTTGAIEVVRCTARAADTLTIVRGQDGTTPISFTTGSIAEARLTAGMLTDMDWRTAFNSANTPLVLDGSGMIADGLIPAGITRDSELAAGLAGKQNTLGFTPVQQGTGVGQSPNVVKIGWKAGSKIGITIDASDQGNIAMEGWVTSLRGAASGLAPLDGSGLVPVGNIPALGYLATAGGTVTGSMAVNGTLSVGSTISTSGAVQTSQTFQSSGANVVVAGNGGAVYLRPNGPGSSSGEAVLANTGVMTGVNFVATSDRRLKKLVRKHVLREDLADSLHLKTWVWKRTGEEGLGPIAQSVQDVAPEYVHRGPDGMLAIDKGGLAIEMAIGLAARLRRLEASHVA